jgi:hypothetical protein
MIAKIGEAKECESGQQEILSDTRKEKRILVNRHLGPFFEGSIIHSGNCVIVISIQIL